MKPSEVYHVLQELVGQSEQMLKSPEQQALIRWHFTLDKQQYFKLLSTFVKSYLTTTIRGKRSVLLHMNKIGFDFNRYVDICFKSTITYFVSLPIGLDILMMYLVEGVKILFRYTYAVMKVHKAFIKGCKDPATLLEGLKAESREKTKLSKIHKAALKYNLKRSNYDYSKANIDKFKDPHSQIGASELSDYMPNCPMNSTILKFDEFVKLWSFLPDYVKIRIPELVYNAGTDGFNLAQLYRKMAVYKNEYKFSLLLIQTKKNEVFGAFIDEVFRKYLKGYVGSPDSFVFTLKPEMKVYYDLGAN